MGVDLEEDLYRKAIELNLAMARRLQSPRTGYVHWNAESPERQDTIPLLENFCFVLALFRSRLAENILEGKALLGKLLVFENDGNFPIFLHEYPECKDRAFSLEILPIFHWLLTDFRSTLGDELALHLEMLIGRILSHGYKMHKQRPLAKVDEFRLKSYFEPERVPELNLTTSEDYASVLISEQIARSRGIRLKVFEEILQKWHPQLCVFLGPQAYEGGEPKVTLFDLFMGHYYGCYSRRALELQPCHLLASLVQPFEEKDTNLSFASLCHVSTPQSYTLYWGSPQQLHALEIDLREVTVETNVTENALELHLTLPPKTFQEGEEAMEIPLFFNTHPLHQIEINRGKATTFQLGDAVTFLSEEKRFECTFSLEQGEGRFFGHICRANRPSQKGKNLKFAAFDWQVALRTIRRSEHCQFRLKLAVGVS